VFVVPAKHPKYILIDGYLRVAAAKHCGKDTLLAQIWYGKEQEALIHVLAKTGERKWDVFEEAGLEGQWLSDIKMVAHIIRRHIKRAPCVMYAGQNNLDKRCLLTAFEQTKDLILSLDEKIRRIDDDIRGQEADGYNTASFGVPDTQNQLSAEHITQRGSWHCQEQNKQYSCQTRPLPTS